MTTIIGTFVGLIISGMVLMISMIGTFVWLIIAFFASFAIIATTMYPFIDDEKAGMEIQKMIDKGYLNADYTIEEWRKSYDELERKFQIGRASCRERV